MQTKNVIRKAMEKGQ